MLVGPAYLDVPTSLLQFRPAVDLGSGEITYHR
jgi:hypothetical protein